jgi:TatD DNase family protein
LCYDLWTVISYIDTHIHLDCLDAPLALLDEARDAGVGAWVVPGTSCERWAQLMATTGMHAEVYAAPGVHPQAADRCTAADLEELRRLLQHPRVVALGEVGLDRQVGCPWPAQEELFVQMIRLAREADKPLLIHTRRSTERVLEILRQEGADQVGGIFHAFSGSLETAREIIALNFAIGVGGVVTFATARRLPEVVRKVPPTALVLETDAPDLAPEPYRGQPNRPAYLALVAERVAALRGWSKQETARITTVNACRILKLTADTVPD